MARALVLAAVVSWACTPVSVGEHAAPSPTAQCGQVLGETPSLDGVEAATRCTKDPAGTGCDAAGFLTTGAAICAAHAENPQVTWSGGLFYDQVAHRPVWRMFASLRTDQPAGHGHLLLDASSGKPIQMLTIDARESTLHLIKPDAEPSLLPEFAGNIMLIGDELVGFDARAGKKFAEAFKVATRTITADGAALAISASLDAEGDVRPVTFTGQAEISADRVRVQAIVPVDERSVSLDLVASRPVDDP